MVHKSVVYNSIKDSLLTQCLIWKKQVNISRYFVTDIIAIIKYFQDRFPEI